MKTYILLSALALASQLVDAQTATVTVTRTPTSTSSSSKVYGPTVVPGRPYRPGPGPRPHGYGNGNGPSNRPYRPSGKGKVIEVKKDETVYGSTSNVFNFAGQEKRHGGKKSAYDYGSSKGNKYSGEYGPSGYGQGSDGYGSGDYGNGGHGSNSHGSKGHESDYDSNGGYGSDDYGNDSNGGYPGPGPYPEQPYDGPSDDQKW